ncbi:MAG: site-2 protease family protein [Gammaproteobacteria bacterium]|nr:site-2 protease family protein [Gammaproteobacteria bacterium]
MEFLGWALFLFALIHAVNIITVWQFFLKVIIPYQNNITTDEELFVPDYMSDLYHDFQYKTSDTEFELFDHYSATNLNKQRVPIIIYKSKNQNTFIGVTAPYLYNKPNQLSIFVSSTCDDGREITHNNFQCLLSHFPLANETHINETAVGLDLLKCHQKYLTENNIVVSEHAIDTSTMYSATQNDTEVRFSTTANKKKTRKTDRGYRITIFYALLIAVKNVFSQKQPVENQINTEVPKHQDIPTSRKAHFYSIFEEANNTVLDATTKWFFFGLSLVMFLTLGTIVFDWDTLITLTVVIFIHELGHWSAMRFFGYKNAQLFFIPLLGGVATAKTESLNRNHQTWILLLGPLPGIIIGFAIMPTLWFNPYAFFSTASVIIIYKLAMMFIFINALNMLPFMPLDGGQLFNLVLPNNTLFKNILTTIISVIAVATAIYFSMYILALIFCLPLYFQLTQRKDKKIDNMVNTTCSQKEIFMQLCERNPTDNLYSHYQKAQSIHLESNATPLHWINRTIIVTSLILIPLLVILFMAYGR